MTASSLTPGLSMPAPDTPGPAHDEALSNEALCRLALAGRREAWDALVARHHRRVVVSLLARGLQPHLAREAANEAWARLIERQAQGRLEQLSLPALVLQQAHFLALDLRRAEGRRPEPLEAEASEVADPSSDAERSLLSREALARARAALAGCGPSAQAAFELVYGEAALSHAQAAARLGLSEQRVRQSLCEVRKKLRLSIEDDRHEP